jgi:hypothetical protein
VLYGCEPQVLKHGRNIDGHVGSLFRDLDTRWIEVNRMSSCRAETVYGRTWTEEMPRHYLPHASLNCRRCSQGPKPPGHHPASLHASLPCLEATSGMRNPVGQRHWLMVVACLHGLTGITNETLGHVTDDIFR